MAISAVAYFLSPGAILLGLSISGLNGSHAYLEVQILLYPVGASSVSSPY